jgi:adenylate cyclase
MRLAPAIGGALCVGAMLTTLWGRGQPPQRAWPTLEWTVLDLWFRLRGETPPVEAVALVAVDDRTEAERPAISETRAGLAELIEATRRAGAKGIAFDLLLLEPERVLPDDLTRDVRAFVEERDPTDPATRLLARVDAETRGDDRLEEALGPDVLLGFHLGSSGDEIGRTRIPRATWGQVVPGPFAPDTRSLGRLSLPRFNQAAGALGILTVREVRGAVRRVPIVRRVGPRHFVPFGVQMVAYHEGIGRGELVYRGDDGTASVGPHRIVPDDGQVWLNWRSPGAIEQIPAIDVLRGEVDLDGRMAMIAYTALGQDTHYTPWGRAPASLVHATLMDNVLHDDLLVRAPTWAELLLVGVVGGLVVIGFAVPGLSRARPALAGLSLVVAVGVPAGLFLARNVWIGVVGAWLCWALVTVVCFVLAWAVEGAAARALRSAFAHYVSDELLATMVEDPGRVRLGGERRDLSVLFSDIRDFTTYSERIEPLVLIGFLNHYLTPMTRAVMGQRGYVDKYIGDAVMALFGAPVADPHHAAQACRAAVDMYRGLDEVRPRARELGVDLQIGVGINSGEVAVGNMGSEERFEYTVLGDAVNLAARLEGLTKTYGVFCLLGEATVASLPAGFTTRWVDRVRVKGKDQPVDIHELCACDRHTLVHHAEPTTWEVAREALLEGDFPRAREAFGAFQEANPADPVVAIHLERLADHPHAPAGWQGVFVHTRK